MRKFGLLLLSVALLSTSCAKKEHWEQLFNGKDLTGWTIKITGCELGDNYNNTFRVVDGILTASYDQYEEFGNHFGHLFTNKSYSDYRLRVEYRFVGEQVKGGPGWAFRNSGAMLHSQTPETMLLDQDFPVSIEAQLLGAMGDTPRSTMNVCTPGTHINLDGKLEKGHCHNSTSESFVGDQWVTVEMLVLNDSLIQHIINGEVVMEYTKPIVGGGNKPSGYPVADNTPLKSGHIAFQSESHGVEFRKIEILDLSK